MKVDLSGLKIELKNLEAFLDELKAEMKSDGLIESDLDEVELMINDEEMKVNGEKVSDELHRKYLDIMEKYSIEKGEEEFKLHFNH
jgi:beta-galactosidase beta subunit